MSDLYTSCAYPFFHVKLPPALCQPPTENLRAVSADLRGLADAAKRHPSQVLFGEAPPKPDLAK
ncbi:MAG: hypothetical protein HY719_08030 [Planctomycetes bacterium]|nr:hypothetical protein [Planctomycetota bacterium]